MIRTAEWKYVHRYPNGPCEIYDLIHDPDERTNLADDPEYSSKKIHLHREMESWFDRYVEPDVDGKNRPVTGSGQLRPIGASWDDGSQAFAKRDD